MKRDIDIIRKIAFALENENGFVRGVEGVSDTEFRFNGVLMIEAGLVDGVSDWGRSREPTQAPETVLLKRLTWRGYEFLSLAGENKVWEEAKATILRPGATWAFSLFFEWLKQHAG
ncbi:MAG: DUF2513 domain-containing protein [Deltaproteobacteria bacterium]|nr:DUF2513 domain-containing protein [Deltaproteobacteria bacterium]